MDMTREQLAQRMSHPRWPRSSTYDPDWVLANAMGPNALWLTEWLDQAMDLQPGMRVLDLGCGKAMSSIFLAKEFGLQVWAADLWIAPEENWPRIQEAGAGDAVFPLNVEAHALPFAHDFFDAIVSIDSYHYYGTDTVYLGYLLRCLKRGGQIGIAVPGMVREMSQPLPQRVAAWVAQWPEHDRHQVLTFQTADWWRRHWAKTGLVDVETADTLEDGWRDWLTFYEIARDAGEQGLWYSEDELCFLADDRGKNLGFARVVARRR